MKTIINKPVITEKSLKAASRGIYTFEVDKSSRKEMIKKTIEKIFQVHIKSISTITVKGKVKVAGKKRQKIKQPYRKKALVTLSEGEKISMFEVGQSK